MNQSLDIDWKGKHRQLLKSVLKLPGGPCASQQRSGGTDSISGREKKKSAYLLMQRVKGKERGSVCDAGTVVKRICG